MFVFPTHLSNKLRAALLLLLFSAGVAGAQPAGPRDSGDHLYPVRYFKAGTPLTNLESWAFGWERRLSEKNSLTFGVQFIPHNNPEALGLFSGDLTLYYREDAYITRQSYYPYNVLDATVEKVGTEPLPPIGEFIPVSSLTFDMGWRLPTRTRRHLFWIFEPGFCLTYHRFIHVKQYEIEQNRVESSQLTGVAPYQYEQITISANYKQVREMRYMQKWVPGLSYQIGLGCRISRRWVIELRGGGIFIPNTPYESPQIAPVKPLQPRLMLMAGVGF